MFPKATPVKGIDKIRLRPKLMGMTPFRSNALLFLNIIHLFSLVNGRPTVRLLTLLATFIPTLISNQAYSFEGADYEKLGLKVFVESIRAGNHDPSGRNSYYFTYSVVGVRNDLSVQGVEIEKRPQFKSEEETFFETELDALSSWSDAEKKTESASFALSGDTLRSNVARGMREYSVKENEIGIQVVIKMYEKNKRFYFFGEDTFVGQTDFFPITVSEFQVKSGTNLKLDIKDDIGTQVIVKVRYEQPPKAK